MPPVSLMTGSASSPLPVRSRAVQHVRPAGSPNDRHFLDLGLMNGTLVLAHSRRAARPQPASDSTAGLASVMTIIVVRAFDSEVAMFTINRSDLDYPP